MTTKTLGACLLILSSLTLADPCETKPITFKLTEGNFCSLPITVDHSGISIGNIFSLANYPFKSMSEWGFHQVSDDQGRNVDGGINYSNGKLLIYAKERPSMNSSGYYGYGSKPKAFGLQDLYIYNSEKQKIGKVTIEEIKTPRGNMEKNIVIREVDESGNIKVNGFEIRSLMYIDSSDKGQSKHQQVKIKKNGNLISEVEVISDVNESSFMTGGAPTLMLPADSIKSAVSQCGDIKVTTKNIPPSLPTSVTQLSRDINSSGRNLKSDSLTTKSLPVENNDQKTTATSGKRLQPARGWTYYD